MDAASKSDMMQCRNWRNGTCPRSDPVILVESSQYLQMGCRTCHGGWVFTLPDGKAKARYENRIAAIKKAEEARRAREAVPTYFT